MAYSDYTSRVNAVDTMANRFSPGGLQIPEDPQRLGIKRVGPPLTQLPESGPEMPVAPDASGALPTNTRQQALQSVQQAYAGRMPGQMDALNSALTNFAQPVGLTDPGIQPALRAGAMGDQRNFERQRQALAELLGSQNLGDSGAMNTQTLGIAQRIGEAGAARDAGLVYDEMGSRRNALLSALGMDQSRYNVDQDLGLRLAQLEALLNQQAMAPFFY